MMRQAFEQEIFKASLRSPADGEANIFMSRGMVVLYRSQDETTFFVVGSDEENEVILVSPPPRARAGMPRCRSRAVQCVA
jgi:hypothetical protein